MGYFSKEPNPLKIRLKKILLSIIGIFILLFIIFHTSPELSIKSHLFLTGHPVEALKYNFEINEFQNNLDSETLSKENSKIYKITNFESNDTNEFFNFKVKKTGLLYFASAYGEA
ncbi:hypothetical protein [Clostridium sp. Ade.TY]|uniref:hypothetical protein n=1 Tax=Clostridium sp. Ade.TY TaxID=1391647 RepID=UPI0004275DD4|nr:hypothetical protein [Clostridium sp. Ade.TY]